MNDDSFCLFTPKKNTHGPFNILYIYYVCICNGHREAEYLVES